MSMKFDVQPAANPTSEKDRVAKLVDPGSGTPVEVGTPVTVTP